MGENQYFQSWASIIAVSNGKLLAYTKASQSRKLELFPFLFNDF